MSTYLQTGDPCMLRYDKTNIAKRTAGQRHTSNLTNWLPQNDLVDFINEI